MPTESLKLPTHFNIEPELREQLTTRPGVQRCVEGNEELLLIAHDVPRPGTPEKVILFWRRHDGRWVQPDGPGISELEDLLARYMDAIDAQQEIVSRAAGAAAVFGVLRHAGPLARSLEELVRALEQALSFDPDDRPVRTCRDRALEIHRAADLLHGDARATLDFLRTEQGEAFVKSMERIGRTVNRLNVLIVVFLPMTALGVILGVNAGVPLFVKIVLWALFLAGMVITAAVLWLPGAVREDKGLLDTIRNWRGK